MEKQEIGLSEENLKRLDEIENEILELDELDERMDYVDELVIFMEFNNLTDEQEDQIDEYLRDFVMDTM